MSFDYIKDPLDEIIRIIGDKRERKKTAKKARSLIYHGGKTDYQIAKFWGQSLKNRSLGRNLIIDRGLMSAAVYNLNDATETLSPRSDRRFIFFYVLLKRLDIKDYLSVLTHTRRSTRRFT